MPSVQGGQLYRLAGGSWAFRADSRRKAKLVTPSRTRSTRCARPVGGSAAELDRLGAGRPVSGAASGGAGNDRPPDSDTGEGHRRVGTVPVVQLLPDEIGAYARAAPGSTSRSSATCAPRSFYAFPLLFLLSLLSGLGHV